MLRRFFGRGRASGAPSAHPLISVGMRVSAVWYGQRRLGTVEGWSGGDVFVAFDDGRTAWLPLGALTQEGR